MVRNRQITLAARPIGLPKESDFALVETEMPHPNGGEVLVQTVFLSVDPYVRGRLTGITTYARGLDLGEVIIGGVVGRVVESSDPRLAVGDTVEGMLGWQEYAVASAKRLRKIDPADAPISTALYVLGMPGLTAYFGLLDICRPQPAETVLISGAAGAVGSIVGQIARIKRCRAIGIAGSDEKVRSLVEEFHFDGAFNHRATEDYDAKIRELCPNGVDVYFDNVGGVITDAVMRRIATRARVAVCGQSSQYNSVEPETGPRWLGQLVVRQAKVEGFLVNQFADRFDTALAQLSNWLKEGRIRYREDVIDGLENAPRAFIRMLKGESTGKQLVKVSG
ncbi:MAG: NADP-dependent oxidoreductase [Candidatus Solibacter sp.]